MSNPPRLTVVTLLAAITLLLAPMWHAIAVTDPPSAPAATAPTTPDFAGRWMTSFGEMTLERDGDRIRGMYALGGGSTIEGRLTEGGRRFEFTYAEPGVTGEGHFQLSADGNSFAGQWRETGSTHWHPWEGRRAGVAVSPNVRPSGAASAPSLSGNLWLVILEVNWEHSIGEPQYDFGSMLNEYFTMSMSRHVHVRHRFFDDEASFKRLVAGVVNHRVPTVLLISAHGTTEGVVTPGGIIGPEVIGDALASANHLILLHLSGCSMIGGDVPQRIHARLNDDVAFPISGYRYDVPWDVSALGDFTFLSMLLNRRMRPAAAAARAREVSPYIGDSVPAGSVFPALGLGVVER